MNQTDSKNNQDRPSIYEYIDYREFLEVWFRYLKRDGLSMRKIAEASNISSGYLPMVLKHERGLSFSVLDQMQPVLKLQKDEVSYLKYMITMSDSESQKERMKAYKAIHRFHTYKEGHAQEIESHEYLSHWYNVAIREMGRIKGVGFSAKKVRKLMNNKIPLSKIEKSLKFLKQTKMIEKDSDGNLNTISKRVHCRGGVYRLSMAEFHKQMLELAIDSIYKVSRPKREIVSHTFAMDQSKMDEAKGILREALEKIQGLGDQSKQPNSVYQFSMLLFPLAEKGDSNE